jgi:hypothetical protein
VLHETRWQDGQQGASQRCGPRLHRLSDVLKTPSGSAIRCARVHSGKLVQPTGLLDGRALVVGGSLGAKPSMTWCLKRWPDPQARVTHQSGAQKLDALSVPNSRVAAT